MSRLVDFFNPKSIAVVGVSSDPSKLGSVILSNIMESGFEGKIFPVNPKYSELFGLPVFPTIESITEPIDVVCLVIPPEHVLPVIEQSVEKGIKYAVIITAGFGEIGKEGKSLEEKIHKTAEDGGMRILGPNCLGFMSTASNLNLTFAASYPKHGNIAFMSQSGAICTAMLDMSLEKNVGFSHFVSLGNKVDIDEIDLLQNWIEDDEVSVIGAYLEEIDQGERFAQVAASTDKPIIIFKPGDTEEAKEAIVSHTGSMAGSAQIAETAFAQSGVIDSSRVNEMFNLMMGFSWAPLPTGNRVAVVTNAGGPGIIATDEIVKAGLRMADLSPESKQILKENLPVTANTENPVDVIGDALAERYKIPIEILVKDENVDSILVILTPQLVTQIEDTAKLIINSAKLSKKPIYAVFLGGKYVAYGLQRLYDAKVPAFKYIREAVDVIAQMYKHGKETQSLSKLARSISVNDLRGEPKHKNDIGFYLSQQPVALPEDIVEKLAAEFDLDMPQQKVVTTYVEALEFAKPNYPVVLKATTEDLPHKTETEGIYVNISNDVELEDKFQRLQDMVRRVSGKQNPKILVQEFIKFEEEFFIGANRDGSSDVYGSNSDGFGHLIAVGKGGIYTEIYKDLGYVLVPASRDQVLASLEQTKIWKIIKGYRGKQPLAVNEVLKTIDKIQKIVTTYPEIQSIDLNPLLITKTRVAVVDFKVFVKG